MQLGPYVIEAELGRGGTSVVYRAQGPDGRPVAVKLLARGAASPDDVASRRFERERALQAELGLADGFVPLLDEGESPRGPFLVMPLVEGGTLRERLARGPLALDDAVELARRLAEAVGRAHARGVVHRDLKPENVLFTRAGAPLIADLGLAKRTGEGAGLALSRTGEMRGTAGYMAPEQMEDAKSAGPQADVFSLGAILYECLTGEAAFVGDNPLAVIARVDTGEFAPVRRLRPDCPRWVEAVVTRALARAPEGRFRDGAALARALSGLGLDGRSGGRGGRSVALSLASSLGLAGLGVVLGVTLERRGLVPGARPAPAAARPPAVPDAPPSPDLAEVAGQDPPPAPSPDPAEVAGQDPPTTTPPRLEPSPGDAPPAPAPAEAAPGALRDAAAPAGEPAPSGPLGSLALDRDLGASTRLALVRRHGDPRLRHTGAVTGVALLMNSMFEARALAADEHGFARRWSLVTGAPVGPPIELPGGFAGVLAVTPGGDALAWAQADGQARTLALEGGASVTIDTEGVRTAALAWSPDGRLLAVCAGPGLFVLDVAARALVHRVNHEDAVTAVAFSPGGELVVTGTAGGALHALRCADWREAHALRPTGGPIRALSAGRDVVAAFVEGKGPCLWRRAAGQATILQDLPRADLRALRVAPDDGRVTLVAGGSLVQLEADAGSPFGFALAAHRRLPAAPGAAAVLPDGRVVVATGTSLALLDAATAAPGGPRAIGHAGWTLAAAAAGAHVVSAGADGALRRWPDGAVLAAHDGWAASLDLDAGRRRVAAAWTSGRLRVVGVADGAPGLEVTSTVALGAVALLPDGGVLAGNEAGYVDRFDAAPAAAARPAWRAHGAHVVALARLEDGRVVSWGGEAEGASLALWAAPRGPLRRRVATPAGRPGAFALAPGDVALAVTGAPDGALRWWDLEAGRLVREAALHEGDVLAVALSPAGDLGASAGMDRALCLWDLRDGRLVERVALDASCDVITCLRFEDGGRRLLAGTATGLVLELERR